jgi:hypothetical protein
VVELSSCCETLSWRRQKSGKWNDHRRRLQDVLRRLVFLYDGANGRVRQDMANSGQTLLVQDQWLFFFAPHGISAFK